MTPDQRFILDLCEKHTYAEAAALLAEPRPVGLSILTSFPTLCRHYHRYIKTTATASPHCDYLLTYSPIAHPPIAYPSIYDWPPAKDDTSDPLPLIFSPNPPAISPFPENLTGISEPPARKSPSKRARAKHP